MKKEILVVLGSPNSADGTLSALSISRLNYCKTRYIEGNLIICTGGLGENFNTSEHAHAYYLKKYLLNEGLSKNIFLPLALSKNTVDDAVKIKAIVSSLKDFKLTILTSDFHLERVQLIFREILATYSIEFVGIDSALDKYEFDLLVQHEKQAIKSIQEKGLYY